MTCRELAVPTAVALGLLVGLPAGARAQGPPPVDSGRFSLGIGGYVRSLTGIHDAGYTVPTGDRRSSFHSDVARIEWRAAWGDRLVLEAHQRIQVRVSSSGGPFGSVAGFGVSADPGRAVDLESVWRPDERTRVSHDLDRLAVTAYTSLGDVTVGRQAITWGSSLLFPVADLWARFSPYELDTEEKPGVDAVRVLAYPAPGVEVDAVVADRGARDDVSAGVRATWTSGAADLWGGAGRLWNEAMVLGGATWIFDTTKLRAEAVVPRDLDAGRWLDPRMTLGFDWVGSRWLLTAEYHFNGLGAPDPRSYAGRLASESFARGESYFLGRHYLGGSVSWTADAQERVRVTATALTNLGDPSGALLPGVSWDLGASARLTLGGLLTAGDEPAFLLGGLPDVRLRSEYGTYGSLGYGLISIYF